MCSHSNSNNSNLRRRTHQEMMLQSNSGSAVYQSTKVPMATIYSSTGSDNRRGTPNSSNQNGAIVVENSGIFRSHTVRLIAIFCAIGLLAISLISSSYNRGSNLKDLSDTVVNLTQQLKKLDEENKHKVHDLEKLEKELADKEIELGWEEQHVHDARESQGIMYKTMAEEIKREQDIIVETSRAASKMARANHVSQHKLLEEDAENKELKVALSFALEELAKARSKLPPAPGSGGNTVSSHHQGDHPSIPPNYDNKVWKDGGKDLDTKVKERKLRGKNPWQPGDNVDIVEREDHDGKIALRPGIVTELNSDGTYNIVKLESSIIKSHLTTSQFQTYLTYARGTAAMFEEKQNIYVPVRIVGFIRGSARIGFELHGKYKYILDSDETQEVRECTAMRIHRFAAEGEIVGADKILLAKEKLNKSMM